MANTFKLISSVTVGSGGASSIDFTSIPATYTDLLLKISARGASGAGATDGVYVAFNGTSKTTNHTGKRLYGTGSGTGSDSTAPFYGGSNANGSTASTFANSEIYIPNYAGSTNKSTSIDSVTENNATSVVTMLNAALWSNTAAITSISVTLESLGNFAQYSTAYIYGIKNS